MSSDLIIPGGMRPPGYHFSVDDFFASLVNPPETGSAIADRPIFRFILDLAQSHGTITHLYVLLRDTKGSGSLHDLSDFTCKQLSEFGELRFGPHGQDYVSAPHAQTLIEQEKTFIDLYRAIGRFCQASRFSRWVRLHYFSESYDLAPLFLERRVSALLLTDKPIVTYRLDGLHKEALIEKGWTEKNGLALIRSHLRFERCVAEGLSISEVCAHAANIVDRYGFVVLFTHEVDLANPRVREMVRACIGSLATAGVRSF